jgi:biopolymer transport protein ExbD
MKNLRRIKRMTRAKKQEMPRLNLVSMMDVFTVLLFFLLVNQSNTEELPSPDFIKLPNSIAETKPEQTIVILVSEDQVLLSGEIIATASEVMAMQDSFIPALKEKLQSEMTRVISQTDTVTARSRQVTIMGDKKLPFKLLKKVMASCTAAGYEKISLAVQLGSD